jgi:hypothetical protein
VSVSSFCFRAALTSAILAGALFLFTDNYRGGFGAGLGAALGIATAIFFIAGIVVKIWEVP